MASQALGCDSAGGVAVRNPVRLHLQLPPGKGWGAAGEEGVEGVALAGVGVEGKVRREGEGEAGGERWSRKLLEGGQAGAWIGGEGDLASQDCQSALSQGEQPRQNQAVQSSAEHQRTMRVDWAQLMFHLLCLLWMMLAG